VASIPSRQVAGMKRRRIGLSARSGKGYAGFSHCA
jgi:hypothetical protein